MNIGVFSKIVDIDMNSKLLLIFCLSTILVISSVEDIFASHGSGGSGGCSGDCIPPTLGQDNTGRNYVENGISINGNGFDVSYFEQTMSPQILKIGEPATVTLKIFENSGTSNLTHVFLMLGLEEKTISGVRVQTNPVEMIWENTSDGEPLVTINDPYNFVSNITTNSSLTKDIFGYEDNITEIIFKFTPTQKFNTDVIMVKMWDFKNNAWTNHFYNAIIIDDSKSNVSENILVAENNNSKSEIPNWFKINAGFWAQNQIDDETFIVGIKYLIEQKIMNIPNLQELQIESIPHFIDAEKDTETVGLSPDPIIPDWIKSNAKLWIDGKITDNDFLSGIEFLIKNGIILF